MRRATFSPFLAATAAAAAVGLAIFAVGAWPASTARAAAPPDKPSQIPAGESSKGALGATAPTGAQPSSDALKKEFSEVIEGQLAAFRAGEYARAYTYAATAIRGIFPLADFESMVKTAYPVIANSTAAEFGLAFDTGDEAVINVRVENAEKKSVLYQYILQKEDGKWKISGVAEVKSSGLSV